MSRGTTRVSVITAVYNNRALVADALESVGRQDYPEIELLVIDGGSTDGTVDVVRSFGTRVARLVSEADEGVYDALNKGIALATGEVVGFLHSDDVYDAPDVITSVVRAFEDSEVDAVYGDVVYTERRDSTRVKRTWRSGTYTSFDLWTGWMPPHPTFFMRRRLYAEWGMFDKSFRIAGDYDALLRYLWKHRARCTYLPRTVVRMRTGGISNRSVSSLVRKSYEDMKALKRNGISRFPAIVLKPLRKIDQYWRRHG